MTCELTYLPITFFFFFTSSGFTPSCMLFFAFVITQILSDGEIEECCFKRKTKKEIEEQENNIE
jgi:hypothetical protein